MPIADVKQKKRRRKGGSRLSWARFLSKAAPTTTEASVEEGLLEKGKSGLSGESISEKRKKKKKKKKKKRKQKNGV